MPERISDEMVDRGLGAFQKEFRIDVRPNEVEELRSGIRAAIRAAWNGAPPSGTTPPVEAVLGVGEIAAYLGIRRPNVRKLLERYEIEPMVELGLGPIYARETIVRFKELWQADERARELDARRRATQRARA